MYGSNRTIEEVREIFESLKRKKYRRQMRQNAIFNYREVMGSTNPKEATPGTIRADFAESIDANAVHGSDSPESAKREIDYFFG